MMELSTIMPNTTIKAASVTVFSGMPQAYMTPIEIKTLIGMEVAATNAERNGNNTIITKITTTMDTNKSRTKELTESPTTFGWSAIRRIETLSGRSRSKARSTSSTSFPYRTILWPSRISMERMIAFLPLFVI